MGYPDWQETNTLAQLIFQALSSAGIPLLANPVQIYNTGPVTSTGTPGFMGLMDYPPKNETPIAAFNKWVGNVGINPVGTKVYWKGMQGHPNMDTYTQQAINLGQKCYLCFKPNHVAPYSADDLNTMITWTQNRIAAGLPLAKTVVVLEQELGNGTITGPEIIGMYQHYVPLIRAAIPGITIGIDFPGQGFPGGEAAADPGPAFYDLVGVDTYAQEWRFTQGIATQKVLAIAQAGNKPFGLWEMGSTTGGAVTNSDVIKYLQDITSLALGVLQSGGVLDMFAWYQNEGNVGGPNIINDPGDFRIPYLQTLAAAVTNPAGGSGAVTIPAGGNVTLTPLTPSPGGGFAPAIGLSYDVAMQVLGSAGSTSPWVTAQLFFFDDDTATARAVDRVFWHVPAGAAASGQTRIYGYGPMSGRWMSVTLHNGDSVPVTVAVQMNSTSRTRERHYWSWSVADSNNVPTYTLAQGAGYHNNLGAISGVSVPAGQSKSFLLSLGAGEVWCRLAGNGANMSASLVTQPTSAFTTAELWSDALPAAGDTTFRAIFPRSPVLVTFTNGDNVAHTPSAQFILLA